MLVVTLGDLLLDVVVRLDEPLATGADANAVTNTSTGGQAANVAAWVAALGGQARCVARRGEDAAGVWLAADLTARGVELVGPTAGRNGVRQRRRRPRYAGKSQQKRDECEATHGNSVQLCGVCVKKTCKARS